MVNMADDANNLLESNYDLIRSMDDNSEEIRANIGRLLYQNNGARQFTTFQDALYGFDNIKNTMYMPEMEGHGFTFITRPKLNMSPSSLRGDRILSMLDTMDVDTVGFAIRALLDTRLTSMYSISTSKSSLLNDKNPFIPILTNRLLSLNGWPDPTIDIETTEGGFFSESITYPKGHDQLSRNYDISASFSDIQGSLVFNLFMMWVRWIHLATRGHVTAYMEDIESRRMCFTSSIYRFVMDPSNRYITKWAKATGCFPRSVPAGAYFNYDSNASNVDVAMNLSIPFTVSGKIEYMDPIIMKEFNMLLENRISNISSFIQVTGDKRLTANFRCLPWIDLEAGNNELKWVYDPEDSVATDMLLSTFENSLNTGPTTSSTNANQ